MTDEHKAQLDELKSQADLLGLAYHPSIGMDKLREKLAEHKAGNETTSMEDGPVTSTLLQRKREAKLAATKLVRVKVACMNPNKKAHKGTLRSAGNDLVGTVKRFIPFNKIWHVEAILLKQLQKAAFTQFEEVNTKDGITIKRPISVKEFSVEVMPDLTKEELAKLAKSQAARNSIDEE